MEHLYKRKFIILIILGLIIVACLQADARKKNIPAPVLNFEQHFELDQGGVLTLQGKGFIANYPQVHKVFINDIHLPKSKLIPLTVLSANTDNLKVLIPDDISLGDYDLNLKIASKFLKSQTVSSLSRLKIRPKAAPEAKLNYNVISNYQELDEILGTKIDFDGLELQKEIKDTLQIGVNFLYQVYYRDGYKSIKSPYTKFYFLPEAEFENELKVISETPLTSFAIEKNKLIDNGELDVSEVTDTEILELSKHFYLVSATNPRYLEHTIKLEPVYIDKVHVLEDEFATLKNRSSIAFPLKSCTLSDSLQIRYKFTDKDFIPTHNSITITSNLGLNNTGSDLLRLQCPSNTNGATLIIDEFKYDKIDADGFGIRL